MFDFSLSATLAMPVTHLFEAFHKTELLVQWFAPGNIIITQVMSNFEEAGRYRITMQEPSGVQYVLTGEYSTIRPNESLMFSWAWEDNQEESVMTSVNVSFEEVDAHTSHLTLIHSGFSNEQERDQHQQGWVACLEKLSKLKA
ncbi:SRPBCC family protein [Alteromonas pelagimontana]|nr:SRPBCC domain-containing protein [Alteromonas pelagimontana]